MGRGVSSALAFNSRLGDVFAHSMNTLCHQADTFPSSRPQMLGAILRGRLTAAGLADLDTAHSRGSVRDFYACAAELPTTAPASFEPVLDRMLAALRQDRFHNLGAGLYLRVQRVERMQVGDSPRDIATEGSIDGFLQDLQRHRMVKYAIAQYDTGELVLMYGIGTYHRRLLESVTGDHVTLRLIGAGFAGSKQFWTVDIDGESSDFKTTGTGVQIAGAVQRSSLGGLIILAPEAGIARTHTLMSALLLDACMTVRHLQSLELYYPDGAAFPLPS